MSEADALRIIWYMETRWIPPNEANNLPPGWVVLFRRSAGTVLVANAGNDGN
jgi:hypothetical protein